MCDLSVILPTCNRGELLERAIGSIWHSTRCAFEIIVVDGASFDRTQSVLHEARNDMGDRLKIIREEDRQGFVKAANKGFAAASGRFVMWMNDDARPLPGSIDAAVEQIAAAPADVGMLAIFHRYNSPRNVAYETVFNNSTYRLLHVRGTLCANFGILRTDLLRELGGFDERYYLNAADTDLSMKLWHSGKKVAKCYNAYIDHDEHEDGRRYIDLPRAQEDNNKLFAKWDLPPKVTTRNPFDPQNPCTVRGLLDTVRAAA